jgi:hypothetical protein
MLSLFSSGRRWALLTLALILTLPTAATAATAWGPGPHWMDSIDAGLTSYSVTVNFSLFLWDTENQPVWPAIDVTLTGTSVVWRGDASDNIGWYPFPPPASIGTIDGHLDAAALELVALDLSGDAGALGPVTMHAGDGGAELGWPSGGWSSGPPPLFSGGYMIETGDPTLVDSFFDVFFELDVNGELWRNQTPLRIHAIASQDPMPQVTYHAGPPGVGISLFREGCRLRTFSITSTTPNLPNRAR